jgi:hypothetical protein
MIISDERLRWLSSPDYIRSEPGAIAAELLAARKALRDMIDMHFEEDPRDMDLRIEQARACLPAQRTGGGK